MGCNFNDLALCPNKCDCGNMLTHMAKDRDNIMIESSKKKKSLKSINYTNSKNFFQIINEKENIIQKNEHSINLLEPNPPIKEPKINNNISINNEQNIVNGIDFQNIDNIFKVDYINNRMNNVTIEKKENNEDNSSFDEGMKENGTQIILENSIKNYDIHLKDNKNITENNINNQQNNENFEEDLVNIMKLIDKNDELENDNNDHMIDFNGEKCLFKGKLQDKKNICGNGVINLKDGSIYEGTFVNGKLDGNGIYTSTNGTIYEGNFIDGNLNGKGKITTIMDNDIQSNGKSDEENKIYDINKNKKIYEGDIKDFKKEGKGIETCSEYKYEGDFHNDMKHGQGSIIYFKIKQKYRGEFKNDYATGYGSFEWENKQKYEGNVVNGKMEGKGVYSWPDGSEYNGEYKNNVREGEGTFKWANGVIFQGKFVNGRPDGKGKLIKRGKSKDVEYKNGNYVREIKEDFKKLNK